MGLYALCQPGELQLSGVMRLCTQTQMMNNCIIFIGISIVIITMWGKAALWLPSCESQVGEHLSESDSSTADT